MKEFYQKKCSRNYGRIRTFSMFEVRYLAATKH